MSMEDEYIKTIKIKGGSWVDSPKQDGNELKRQAIIGAKMLVKRYLEKGYTSNMGVREGRRCASEVNHTLGYHKQRSLQYDFKELYKNTGKVLYDDGRGMTTNPSLKKVYAQKALKYIDGFYWVS